MRNHSGLAREKSASGPRCSTNSPSTWTCHESLRNCGKKNGILHAILTSCFSSYPTVNLNLSTNLGTRRGHMKMGPQRTDSPSTSTDNQKKIGLNEITTRWRSSSPTSNDNPKKSTLANSLRAPSDQRELGVTVTQINQVPQWADVVSSMPTTPTPCYSPLTVNQPTHHPGGHTT